MCLTLRSHVEPKIARLSSSYVQSSGYVLLGSSITVVPSHQALPLAQAPPWRRYGMRLALFLSSLGLFEALAVHVAQTR
jgi:hypothetical protein